MAPNARRGRAYESCEDDSIFDVESAEDVQAHVAAEHNEEGRQTGEKADDGEDMRRPGVARGFGRKSVCLVTSCSGDSSVPMSAGHWGFRSGDVD